MLSKIPRLKGELFTCLLLMMLSFACWAEPTRNNIEDQAQQETPRDGQVRQTKKNFFEAWDDIGKQWVGIELFWRRYAQRRGGLTWGSRTEYPRYSKVKELDTMIINLPQGPCMMEFFHNRWRRANNVRRWSKEFDAYGGCPYVFD